MIVIFTIFGLCLGSFLNVVIIRLPENKSVAFPASHCCTCKKSLKFYHNIPLLSWLFLGGKCAYCKSKISIQYPLVEFFTALIFALCFMKEDGDLVSSLILSIVFSALLALSLIDLKYKAVPDVLSLPAMLLAFFANDLLFTLKWGLIFAGGFSLLRMLISFIVKKEAMGEADIIIAAIIGSILGLKLGLIAIYISAVIALPIFLFIRKKNYELPYIPFLTFSLALCFFLDEEILKLFEIFYG